jgi:hypothetical protein
MENFKKEMVLEPSTNTHKLEGNIVSSKDLGDSMLSLRVEGAGIVTHGEHGTLRTESTKVAKVVQQEYNPVTKAMQNAFD